MRWITTFAILFSALAAVRPVDGGMGMAGARVRFLDADGQALAANGGNLRAWQALRWMNAIRVWRIAILSSM